MLCELKEFEMKFGTEKTQNPTECTAGTRCDIVADVVVPDYPLPTSICSYEPETSGDVFNNNTQSVKIRAALPPCGNKWCKNDDLGPIMQITRSCSMTGAKCPEWTWTPFYGWHHEPPCGSRFCAR